MHELEALLTPMFVKVMDQRARAGPPGLPGRDGQNGRDGQPGPTGQNGRDGQPGRDGEKGETGAQGLTGSPGNKGEAGQGQVGQPGRDGRDGLPGPQGPTGERGLKGEVGLPGPQGIQGVQGIKGSNGNKGSNGIKGKIGAPGVKGEMGESNLFELSVFLAFKTNGGTVSTGIITFDTIVLGDDLLHKSSGVFTCKTGGTYLFVFSGEDRGASWIGVYLNDNRELILQDTNSDSQNNNVSFTWTLNLYPEDRVFLKIESGNYYVDADTTSSRIYFTGFMVKASTQ